MSPTYRPLLPLNSSHTSQPLGLTQPTVTDLPSEEQAFHASLPLFHNVHLRVIIPAHGSSLLPSRINQPSPDSTSTNRSSSSQPRSQRLSPVSRVFISSSSPVPKQRKQPSVIQGPFRINSRPSRSTDEAHAYPPASSSYPRVPPNREHHPVRIGPKLHGIELDPNFFR